MGPIAPTSFASANLRRADVTGAGLRQTDLSAVCFDDALQVDVTASTGGTR
jgi:hypothetical protein